MNEGICLARPAVSNIIGLNQMGRKLGQWVRLSAEHLYEAALFARSERLELLLMHFYVEREQLAKDIEAYLIENNTDALAANDHEFFREAVLADVPDQVKMIDEEIIQQVNLYEKEFASNVKRLAGFLPEFPNDLLLAVGFSCSDLNAALEQVLTDKVS